MNLVRVTNPEEIGFHKGLELYRESFPLHEQRLAESQKRVLARREYYFDLICDQKEFVGIILYWETQDFLYVEHFAIIPAKQSRNYGRKTLSLLSEKEKTIILEIDPPEDEISLRRKGFYERAQYKENKFEHVHPPYREGFAGHPLMVMSYPAPLTQEEYETFAFYLQNTVMD